MHVTPHRIVSVTETLRVELLAPEVRVTWVSQKSTPDFLVSNPVALRPAAANVTLTRPHPDAVWKCTNVAVLGDWYGGEVGLSYGPDWAANSPPWLSTLVDHIVRMRNAGAWR